MRDCIAQFDHDITLKANKNSLNSLRKEVQDNFMNNSQIPIIETKIKDVHEEIKK